MFSQIARVCVVATLATLFFSLSSVSIAGTTQQDKAASDAKARDYFTNMEVIDQDGERLRFYDDVLKDKVVVISFIFTNCEGACPLMTRNLTTIRDMLGGEVGKSIHFVTLSLDPVRDTPAAMKEFAQTHRADEDGWLFLTGKPDNVNFVVSRLGQYTDNLEAHTTLLLAANVRTAHWTKIPPTVPPQGVAQRLRVLLEDDQKP